MRFLLPEDMADSAAGAYLHAAAALPHPERHLQVLAAPDVHGLVVGAGGPEVVTPDAEEATGHHRRPVGPRAVLSHLGGEVYKFDILV